ncbi:hypothetical protein MA16_Dca022879 [Dendrobium catenatum]|uniref:Reverse transcriptase domain-containing protein n=1 Tax=Dendrobium catenatum TaxID=906689 RepID=A0A2I0WC88_9ASPA|nr:hypothetical protein MA16_Dca022879 [Dendrobium catenatum]
MPRFFTSTAIVLIPKKDNPEHWRDFRPISLCSFFNKLTSKIIAIRLGALLPRLISPNQSGFVKGRLISDNILLTQELVHDLNSPSLFIISMDYFSRCLNALFERYPSMFFRSKDGLPISHLCFADDFIIFSNGSFNHVKKLKDFLDLFSFESGLIFNASKCAS